MQATIESVVPDNAVESFMGIVPGRGDILGDHWARQIGELFDRTAAMESPTLAGNERHRVWMVWQWMYCELTGMRGRVIASPQAIISAGLPLTPADIDHAKRLLLASPAYLD